MLVLYESRDSGASLTPMWSGQSPFVVSGIRLYADFLETYIIGIHSLASDNCKRFSTQTAGDYIMTDLNVPQTISGTSRTATMTHYYSEFGNAMFSMYAWTNSGSRMYAQNYPEYSNGWADYGALPETPIDVVFPDTPDSPRFVFGFGGNTPEKVWIVLCDTSGLWNQHQTIWNSPLVSGSAITDLECVRFI